MELKIKITAHIGDQLIEVCESSSTDTAEENFYKLCRRIESKYNCPKCRYCNRDCENCNWCGTDKEESVL
mgnify:CR=1 FL=1